MSIQSHIQSLFFFNSGSPLPLINPLDSDPNLLAYLTPEDSPFPIAFSRALPFSKPDFGLFVFIRVLRDRHSTPVLLFSICERISGSSDFDFDYPLFMDTSFDSAADIWTLFA